MTLPIDRVDLESLDIADLQQQKLKEIFPEVFTEGGKIDFDKLKLTLGQAIDTGKERFGMNWAGKADCYKTIQQPSVATLAPARDESIDFDTTENLFIEGDNLEVLKLLQKSYLGKVKMIYIDPPYNKRTDFIYPDNYAENLNTYLEYTGQLDGEGRKFSTNTEIDGRLHSKWMSMMYPRLFLAKNLLTDDGVIFISIDDDEVNNLRAVANEIFGEENFVAIFPWKKRTAKSDVPFGVSQDYEWILCYTKSALNAGIGLERRYYQTDDYPNDKWRLSDLTKQTSADERPNSAFDMVDPKTKKSYPFNPKRTWSVSKDTFQDYYDKGKIVFPDDYDFLRITIPAYRVFESEDRAKAIKKYGSDEQKKAASTFLPKEVGMSEDGNKDMVEIFGSKLFSFPKPVSLIKHLLAISNDPNAIVLDFFAGSATTAHAVMELNKEDDGRRKFICVQLPEIIDEKQDAYKVGYRHIAEISKERIRRSANKIKDVGIDGQAKTDLFDEDKKSQLLDLGFRVFKLKKSHFKVWDANTPKDAEAIQQALELHVDHIDPQAEQEAILFELLLKSGFELTTPIENLTLAGKTVFSIAEGALLICLDKTLTSEVIKAMAELNPSRVICLDEGFQDNDQLKTNAVLIMKSKGVNDFRTV